MKKNMGTNDKVIRIIIAAIIVVLFFTKFIIGTLAIVLMIVAVVLVLTSFISFCPIWSLLGINTGKKK